MDISIKSNSSRNLFFGSRTSVNRMAKDFADEFLKTFLPKKNFKIKEIQKFAKKYLPDLDVVQMTYDKSPKTFEAVCTPAYEYTDKKFSFLGSVITIDCKYKDEYSRLKVLKNFIHEMTHAFQYNDRDFSDLKIINTFLETHSREELKRMMTLSNRIFDSEKYTGKIENLVNSIINICFQNNQQSRMSFIEYFRKEFESDVRNLRNKKIKFDLDFMKNMLIHQAQSEIDAYKSGNYFALKSNPSIRDYYSIVWAKVHSDLMKGIKASKVQ